MTIKYTSRTSKKLCIPHASMSVCLFPNKTNCWNYCCEVCS